MDFPGVGDTRIYHWKRGLLGLRVMQPASTRHPTFAPSGAARHDVPPSGCEVWHEVRVRARGGFVLRR